MIGLVRILYIGNLVNTDLPQTQVADLFLKINSACVIRNFFKCFPTSSSALPNYCHFDHTH